jgi:hypothetical protein
MPAILVEAYQKGRRAQKCAIVASSSESAIFFNMTAFIMMLPVIFLTLPATFLTLTAKEAGRQQKKWVDCKKKAGGLQKKPL